MSAQIQLDPDVLSNFCRKWRIREMSLFGSRLREDFRPDSDLDVLVSFEPSVPWSLWDMVDMRDELTAITGRNVDLVDKEGLRNPYRRDAILSSREIVYAA
jgi:uncharacterized protein